MKKIKVIFIKFNSSGILHTSVVSLDQLTKDQSQFNEMLNDRHLYPMIGYRFKKAGAGTGTFENVSLCASEC